MNIFLHSYGDFKCNKDWMVEKEACCFSRVYFIKKGEATYSDGVNDVKLKVNSLYIFPQKKEYGIVQSLKNKLETLYFHITTDKELETLVEYEINDKDDISIIELLTNNIKNSREYLENLLAALLIKALSTQKNTKVDDKEIDKILGYIQDNVFGETEISIARLAEKSFYSEGYLIRKFKKDIGITPKQYIINLKLDKVAECMGSQSISNLVFKFGFNSYKNFSNLFKKKYGVSPNEYQQIAIQSRKMSI